MKKKKGLKILLGILLGYFLIMGLGYVGVAKYFSTHFLKGTSINGIDCSNMTIEQVKEGIQDRIGEYKLRIKERDGRTEIISALQVDMTYVDDNKVDQLMEEQSNWKWIAYLSASSNFEFAANTTYDHGLMDGIMDNMNCFHEENVIAPQDAHIQENESGLYEVIPEIMGNTLDREKVKNILLDAIDHGKSEVDLEELDCYIKPEIYQDDPALVEEVEKRNRYLSTDLTYDFGDRTEVVNMSVIKSWMVEKDEPGKMIIDRAKVDEFVQTLANKYDTFGRGRTFTTSLGQKIDLRGGDYGWVIKKTATADALVNAIESGQSGTVQPEYLYKGKSRAANDIGNTYVEICISKQRMWCYKDGVLIVDTPVVTGNPNKGNGTPAGGVWAIDAKKRGATLDGEGYSQDVEFWLPFNGNVGIHDADAWRSEYGGQIYLASGSHGCVNTPTQNAEKVFQAMDIGYPVIVYE